MRGRRKVKVRKHERSTPSGGKTSVRMHKRNIEDKQIANQHNHDIRLARQEERIRLEANPTSPQKQKMFDEYKKQLDRIAIGENITEQDFKKINRLNERIQQMGLTDEQARIQNTKAKCGAL